MRLGTCDLEFSDEIKQLLTNIYVNKVLETSLIEITDLLRNENYKIRIRTKKDIEFPQWEEIVIEIAIKDLDYDKLFEIWDMIEEKVRKRIKLIETENRDEIEKINEKLALFVEDLR